MNKRFGLLLIAAAASAGTFFFTACKKDVNYTDYISELRRNVYIYRDDVSEVKIYCGEKETPYAQDGVKGAMSTVTEIYYVCDGSPAEVVADIDGTGGEMSYLAVEGCYYLSFAKELKGGSSIIVKFIADGKERTIEVPDTAQEGTISFSEALKCVTEYDADKFESLKNGNNFEAEINIRLLYDDGCYYYVGVCDREKNVKAYLVDGKNGRVIAERVSSAE